MPGVHQSVLKLAQIWRRGTLFQDLSFWHVPYSINGVEIRTLLRPGKMVEVTALLAEPLVNNSCAMDSNVSHKTTATFGIQNKLCRIDLICSNVHILLGKHGTFQHYQGTRCISTEHAPHHDTISRTLSSVHKARWVHCFVGLSAY